ncbi:MAG: ribbon-helix-helix protein, CopG family [Methanocorpusculum sp.]|nr:ribbon-helix-helix protein, CopG family [Methanocorpusculum sp.]MDE2442918.1 ribbon-helix-helix protein, CopG family [Methanocorpusculum sp.]MDE2522023.1 ribbon-helix-helix protein, CopG family [Methanocorpusculum sp.]
MVRNGKSPAKVELVSVRLPVDLLRQLDELKEKEGRDRTAVIVQAVKYWVSVDGKITTDHEYLARLGNLDQNIDCINQSLTEIRTGFNDRLTEIKRENATELRELRSLLAEQQKTINILLRMIPKDE